MQSENFDKRVRDAAEHHHPAYDEKAWDKMEKLLDKHLPQQEENRRRFLFFILLFLLLGGGITGLLVTQPWKKKETVSELKPTPASSRPVDNKTAVAEQTGPSQPSPVTGQPPSAETPGGLPTVLAEEKNDLPKTSITAAGTLGKETTSGPVTEKNTITATGKKPGKPVLTRKKKKDNAVTAAGTKAKSKKNNDDGDQAVPGLAKKTGKDQADKINPLPDGTSPVVVKADTRNDQPVKPDEPSITKPAADQANVDKNSDDIAKEKEEKKEPVTGPDTSAAKPVLKKRKTNALFVTFSTGPDLSMVGAGNPGKVKLLAGLGLSYTIRDRVTIRTGFYSARKIYTAGPDDYKAPPEFYQAYPYLEKVDANCRVYEIPLSVAYHFGNPSNGRWFVSAGISSFLMNEESYNYFYKYTPTGNTYTNRWTIRNENYNLFSVGSLSGGYTRQLGKSVTVTAEPYVRIPFAGVGYGKVKLNSTGVMFTVGVKLR